MAKSKHDEDDDPKPTHPSHPAHPHAPQPTPPPKATATPNTVTIKDNKFDPPVLKVKAGETVTWKNEDKDSHTVTFVPVTPGLGRTVPPPKEVKSGETYQWTPAVNGDYRYGCDSHPGMNGTIQVT